MVRSASSSRSLAISLSRPGVSHKAYRTARSRTNRKRWAGVLARAAIGEGQEVPHLVFCDNGNSFLFQAGRLYIVERILVDIFTLQPVEEPVQTAVTGRL